MRFWIELLLLPVLDDVPFATSFGPWHLQQTWQGYIKLSWDIAAIQRAVWEQLKNWVPQRTNGKAHIYKSVITLCFIFEPTPFEDLSLKQTTRQQDHLTTSVKSLNNLTNIESRNQIDIVCGSGICHSAGYTYILKLQKHIHKENN